MIVRFKYGVILLIFCLSCGTDPVKKPETPDSNEPGFRLTEDGFTCVLPRVYDRRSPDTDSTTNDKSFIIESDSLYILVRRRELLNPMQLADTGVLRSMLDQIAKNAENQFGEINWIITEGQLDSGNVKLTLVGSTQSKGRITNHLVHRSDKIIEIITRSDSCCMHMADKTIASLQIR